MNPEQHAILMAKLEDATVALRQVADILQATETIYQTAVLAILQVTKELDHDVA